MRFLASEFPNDNSALHGGTIWMSEALCGAPEAHFAETAPSGGEAPRPPSAAANGESEDGSDIEVVESFEPLEPVDEGPCPRADPYETLLATLRDVATAMGAAHVGRKLEHTLDIDPAAQAWRAILRGESDDYAACGASTLDEWAAATLARLIGVPSRAGELRRELRSRGVVAFGLLQAA